MENKELHDILQKVFPLIFKYGVRSLTMDDIANKLGISKKTLYLYFENKADLIEKIMLMHIAGERELCENVMTDETNAIDQLVQIYSYNLKSVGNINHTLIFELKKYYGSVWQKFEEHKNNYIIHSVRTNIELGQKQGLFRMDLDSEIISRIHTNRIDMIMDGDVFPSTDFSLKDVIKELLVYHLRGISTEKGINYLESNQMKL
ncbi:MAG: TetR/AcrR family transcriptional regulator [Bacteroidia bacterium]